MAPGARAADAAACGWLAALPTQALDQLRTATRKSLPLSAFVVDGSTGCGVVIDSVADVAGTSGDLVVIVDGGGGADAMFIGYGMIQSVDGEDVILDGVTLLKQGAAFTAVTDGMVDDEIKAELSKTTLRALQSPDDFIRGYVGGAASGNAGTGGDDEDDEGAASEAVVTAAGSLLISPMELAILEPLQRFFLDHVNIVFMGHVDAGKSTIAGHIMYQSGMVDERTMEKHRKEAKVKGRPSWAFAWAMDLSETEREKGKTEEVGQRMFATRARRYTVLDAPGHNAYVRHMVGGAAQADIGVLVISARKGEFETGYERGGQTREHALLARGTGVSTLIVAINKMDEPSVEWNQGRFKEIQKKLTSFLKRVGYDPEAVKWVPISGLGGHNLLTPLEEGVCPWYDGPCLVDLLDQAKPPPRDRTKPMRLPIINKFSEMGGLFVVGKLESGTIVRGTKLCLAPSEKVIEVVQVYMNDHRIAKAVPGDNVQLKIRGVSEDDVTAGDVLCPIGDMPFHGCYFDAQVVLLGEGLLVSKGFSCVAHIHALTEEVRVKKILATIDRKNKKIKEKEPKLCRSGESVVIRFETESPICVEAYQQFPQLGRIVLRQETETIGIGVCTKVLRVKKKE